MESDERALIEDAKMGDAEAFGVIVRRYMPRALAFARQMSGSAEDAQDLVQEAFMKAYLGLGSFKGESSFYTWFLRVLSNLCLDYLRKSAFRKKVFFFAPRREEDDEGSDYSIEQVPDPSQSAMPDEGISRKELRRALAGAIRKLPGRQRAVFLLKHYEGMKLSEVATALGISEGAVKSHLVRAVAALRKSMKGYGGHV